MRSRHTEGGGTKTCGAVNLTRDLEVLAILKRGGGAKSFHSLKKKGGGGWGAKGFTLSP